VAACPADCFYRGKNVLVIDPEACIDCAACVRVCPVDAIYDADDPPDRWAAYGPLPDADAWTAEPRASAKGIAGVVGLPPGWAGGPAAR
jgi:Fe-S-cluster-containing hydrogenase component 2